jgi:hypothetical protein
MFLSTLSEGMLIRLPIAIFSIPTSNWWNKFATWSSPALTISFQLSMLQMSKTSSHYRRLELLDFTVRSVKQR